MRPSALLPRALLGAAAITMLCGCASVVDLGSGWVIEDPSSRCEELLAALPITVSGELARETTPTEFPAAAWGDPPVVLRCGVPRPSGLTPTSSLTAINGVNWLAEPLTNGVLFTSVPEDSADPPLYVSVSVPSDYAPEGSLLVDLTPAILSVQ
ncbi:MAG: hypothetical protein RJB01_25 [Actinomycetota bacterium]